MVRNQGFECSRKMISALTMNARKVLAFTKSYFLMERGSEHMIQLYAKACDDTVRYSSVKGILFITANSSSGSKYYKLLENQQDYVGARSQENQSSYTIIDITQERIQLNTFFTESGKKVDKTIIITK